ncbi:MAG: helix-turn-helix domain-containing protein [Gammaproteobacteria bacterium]|nr:helix-turn-helix domain-containing protein [Gammaproteobacteria bacterium]
MSIKILSKAFEMPLKPNEKLVMLALADCANDDGYAYPGYKKLIQKTSLARATLAKNLKILELAGLFDKEGHATIGEGKSVNTYQLKLDFNENELKKSLENARKSISKSSTVELDELGRKVQTVNRKVQTVKSSQDELRKVQTVNSKSSTVEHEPSVLTVSNEPSESESNSKIEITREEKNSHTQNLESLENSENENLVKSENNFSVDNSVDEKNQHTPTQENNNQTNQNIQNQSRQSRLVRESFWITESDYAKLQDDYFQSEIDDYIGRYNSWVKTSGKESRCPVETIRKWMTEDGARKRPSKEQRRLDEIVRLVNFPRWEWESDESFYERIRRYDKAGLPPHYNGTIRKWKDADVKAQAIQIDRAVRAEYFGEGF